MFQYGPIWPYLDKWSMTVPPPTPNGLGECNQEIRLIGEQGVCVFESFQYEYEYEYEYMSV